VVAWGRHPGAGRSPAPGSQEQFGAIVQAWIDTGADCPRGLCDRTAGAAISAFREPRTRRPFEGSRRKATRVHFLNDDTVQHLIAHYGYGAIFLIVMLESAGIPMPGETILVTAAVYAGTKHALDIRWVIAAAAGGAILGDNIGFWVGREFGEPLLEKWGHIIGLDARKRMLGR
jgi:hypothetical protein